MKDAVRSSLFAIALASVIPTDGFNRSGGISCSSRAVHVNGGVRYVRWHALESSARRR